MNREEKLRVLDRLLSRVRQRAAMPRAAASGGSASRLSSHDAEPPREAALGLSAAAEQRDSSVFRSGPVESPMALVAHSASLARTPSHVERSPDAPKEKAPSSKPPPEWDDLTPVPGAFEAAVRDAETAMFSGRSEAATETGAPDATQPTAAEESVPRSSPRLRVGTADEQRADSSGPTVEVDVDLEGQEPAATTAGPESPVVQSELAQYEQSVLDADEVEISITVTESDLPPLNDLQDLDDEQEGAEAAPEKSESEPPLRTPVLPPRPGAVAAAPSTVADSAAAPGETVASLETRQAESISGSPQEVASGAVAAGASALVPEAASVDAAAVAGPAPAAVEAKEATSRPVIAGSEPDADQDLAWPVSSAPPGTAVPAAASDGGPSPAASAKGAIVRPPETEPAVAPPVTEAATPESAEEPASQAGAADVAPDAAAADVAAADVAPTAPTAEEAAVTPTAGGLAVAPSVEQTTAHQPAAPQQAASPSGTSAPGVRRSQPPSPPSRPSQVVPRSSVPASRPSQPALRPSEPMPRSVRPAPSEPLVAAAETAEASVAVQATPPGHRAAEHLAVAEGAADTTPALVQPEAAQLLHATEAMPVSAAAAGGTVQVPVARLMVELAPDVPPTPVDLYAHALRPSQRASGGVATFLHHAKLPTPRTFGELLDAALRLGKDGGD